MCPLAAKVQAINDFHLPQSKKALRHFLGLCGYYCGNVSNVVAPLASIVSPARPFRWSPACQIAFQSVKTLQMCSVHAFLAAPNFTKPFGLRRQSMWGCSLAGG